MTGRDAASLVGADGKLDAVLVAEYIAPDMGRGLDGDYYEYRNGVYRRDPDLVTKRVAAALGSKYSATLQKQVEAHLLNLWIPEVGVRDLPSGYLDYIVLRNGVYHWRRDELEAHSPLLGALTCLPIVHAAGARPFNFDTWLEQVLGDEPELIRHVWEVIGYVLLTGNPLQKIVLLHGEGGNGKGTMLRVLRRLLGEDNYSSLSLHTLVEDRFAAAGLYGVIANISGDLSSRFVNEPEILKQITGGDSITTARKYGQHFTFVPYAVPIFAANEYFRTSDSSYGWRRRWEVIDFTRDVSKLGHFDEQILFDELPGIFNAAMDGLRRLMERGRFAPPQIAVAATQRLHDSADPFMIWLEDDENVRRGPDEYSPRADVYTRYSRWCRSNGYQPLASGPFGNRLKGIGITTSQSRAGGQYVRHYNGISVMLTPTD
ncbi:phage/plasmid primase, P4 family [Microbacterium sp. NPDC056569]|uniref:DNA primase family protein n=1 Tax=Microbacterium sp. NPDC056569 TaxID=3345867 RepID=UPI00366F2EDA